jgi:hypothetical protein
MDVCWHPLVVAMIDFPEFHVDETVVHLSHHTDGVVKQERSLRRIISGLAFSTVMVLLSVDLPSPFHSLPSRYGVEHFQDVPRC